MPRKINLFWTISAILAIIVIIFFTHLLIQYSSSGKNSVTDSEKNLPISNQNQENSNLSEKNPSSQKEEDVFKDLNSESSFLDDFSAEIDKK